MLILYLMEETSLKQKNNHSLYCNKLLMGGGEGEFKIFIEIHPQCQN